MPHPFAGLTVAQVEALPPEAQREYWQWLSATLMPPFHSHHTAEDSRRDIAAAQRDNSLYGDNDAGRSDA